MRRVVKGKPVKIRPALVYALREMRDAGDGPSLPDIGAELGDVVARLKRIEAYLIVSGINAAPCRLDCTAGLRLSRLPIGLEGLKVAGKEFSIFMPIDVDGKTENRSFVFKIVGAN